MILRVITPERTILETEAVHVTAEDVTGSLGIRPGHAPLVSPLVPGIVMARRPGGSETYVAVNGGVVVVTGEEVRIVSRQAVPGDDLGHLEDQVLTQFAHGSEEAKASRAAFEKMRIGFMRRMLEYERSGG